MKGAARGYGEVKGSGVTSSPAFQHTVFSASIGGGQAEDADRERRGSEEPKRSDMSTTATMGEMANSAVEFYPKGSRGRGGGAGAGAGAGAGGRADGSHSGGDFGASVSELRELMELRGTDAIQKIQDSYGDTEGLCQRLQSSTTDGERGSEGGVGGREGGREGARGWSNHLGGNGRADIQKGWMEEEGMVGLMKE